MAGSLIEALCALLTADAARMKALRALRVLGLPDVWIGAGFVRDAAWDDLHGYPVRAPTGDVDVLWYDPEDREPAHDRAITHRLRGLAPDFDWSVKNQARMHDRNGDRPYASVADAMRHWPETATAVAVRLGGDGKIEVNAPLGVEDLFALRLTPTEDFVTRKRAIFDRRVADKRWMERYPLLTLQRS